MVPLHINQVTAVVSIHCLTNFNIITAWSCLSSACASCLGFLTGYLHVHSFSRFNWMQWFGMLIIVVLLALLISRVSCSVE